MEESKTCRGFELGKFKDTYGMKCSIQESSRAVCENEDGTVDDPLGWIWLGIDDVEPKIMKSDAVRLNLPVEGEICGWQDFTIPKEVLISSRMHLNEAQVRSLVERLQTWLDTGSLF